MKTKIISLGMVLGIAFSGFAQEDKEEKISLELIKEIRLEEGIKGVRVITSQEELEKTRKVAKLSPSEPVFPVKALRTSKGVKFFDGRGNVVSEVKGGWAISENGEYVACGNEIKNSKNKVVWKSKEVKGDIIALSNNKEAISSGVKWAAGFPSSYIGLNFYDSSGRLIKDIPDNKMAFDGRVLAISPNMEVVVAFSETSDPSLPNVIIAFDKNGDKLWNYPIKDRLQLDRIVLSPNGSYTAISLMDWKKHQNNLYLFNNKTGHLIATHTTVLGSLAIAFSPEGDYLGVGDYHNVYLFEAGKVAWKYYTLPLSVDCLSISPKGNIVVGLISHSICGSCNKEEETLIKKAQGKNEKYIHIYDKKGQLLTNKDLNKMVIEQGLTPFAWANIRNVKISEKELFVIQPDRIFLFKVR